MNISYSFEYLNWLSEHVLLQRTDLWKSSQISGEISEINIWFPLNSYCTCDSHKVLSWVLSILTIRTDCICQRGCCCKTDLSTHYRYEQPVGCVTYLTEKKLFFLSQWLSNYHYHKYGIIKSNYTKLSWKILCCRFKLIYPNSMAVIQ